MAILSKTKYLLGLQCPKYLWLSVNSPEKIPEPDKGTQYRFDQGHVVGGLAKKLYPTGIDIPSDDFKQNLEQSKKLLASRKPLFEAAILVNNLYSRADILDPTGKTEWDIIEVKSSTDVKEINLHDVSFQRHCFQLAGLKINKCFLIFINNQYVKHGEIDPEGFFTKQDITREVESAAQGIEKRIDCLQKMMASKKCPEADISPNCSNPYECPVEECWSKIPANSVFDLYRGGKLAFELFQQGIVAIKDIPDGTELNDKQKIQWDCEHTGKAHLHKQAISAFLKTLHYPLYFLDFETINPGLPLYDGTRPYQRIPFQYSLHVLKTEKASLTHHSFLAEGIEDPREAFVNRLKEDLADKGTIIAYNAVFETGVLKELAQTFPQYEAWMRATTARTVDLLAPFRNFHYYHPQQQGSASIKNVLPAITGSGYEGLGISEGGEASLAYLEMTYGSLTQAEKQKIRQDLEKYCEKDTKAMAEIVGKLREAVS